MLHAPPQTPACPPYPSYDTTTQVRSRRTRLPGTTLTAAGAPASSTAPPAGATTSASSGTSKGTAQPSGTNRPPLAQARVAAMGSAAVASTGDALATGAGAGTPSAPVNTGGAAVPLSSAASAHPAVAGAATILLSDPRAEAADAAFASSKPIDLAIGLQVVCIVALLRSCADALTLPPRVAPYPSL